jgi:hypothetical protein
MVSNLDDLLTGVALALAAADKIEEKDAIAPQLPSTVIHGVSLIAPPLVEVIKEGVPGWRLRSVRSEWPFLVSRNRKRTGMLIEAVYEKGWKAGEESFPKRSLAGSQLTQVARGYGRITVIHMDGYGDMGWAYIHFRPSVTYRSTLLRKVDNG